MKQVWLIQMMFSMCGLIFGALGCANIPDNHLYVVTGTTIGLEIGVNELTQTPQGKLGYKRIEGARVPTITSQDGNIISTVPVLARLRFKSIFSTQDAGIESLIATGDAATNESVRKYLEDTLETDRLEADMLEANKPEVDMPDVDTIETNKPETEKEN